MQINNHVTPAHAGNGSRPDHAANPAGRGQRFEASTADTQPAATTETTAAVEPTAETEAADIPGKSVAHQAHAFLTSLTGLGGHNFGWLVSQIAQETFDAAAYTDDGEATDGAVASSGETAGSTATTAATEPSDAGGETPPGDETTEASTTTQTEPEDLVADLVDDLLDDGEDDEGGTEVT